MLNLIRNVLNKTLIKLVMSIIFLNIIFFKKKIIFKNAQLLN